MGAYPDHDTYRALYARFYLGRFESLSLLDPLQGTRVLDLCGGDGRLALGALESGATKATLVDVSEAMIPAGLAEAGVTVKRSPVGAFLKFHWMYDKEKSFDRAVCRQAVNYWLTEDTAGMVAGVLTQGGIFAFNTLSRKPPEKPRVLNYELGGHEFVEVSWLAGKLVHHVQVRAGLEPHCTAFAWLAPEAIKSMLDPHFKVVEIRQGKSSLYRCIKK